MGHDLEELRNKLFAPPKERDRYLNDDSKKQAILALVADGMSIGRAFNKLGLGRATLRQFQEKDPEFVQLLEDAYNQGTDYLEDLALERAHESDSVLIKLLESRRPEKFSNKRQVGPSVKVEIKTFSNGNSTSVSVGTETLPDERVESVRSGGQEVLPPMASSSGKG